MRNHRRQACSTPQATPISINPTFLTGYEPFFSLNLNILLPICTFGKITSAIDAAEANVRVNEWDVEKWRQLSRMDVRRAYFGVMYARDARYLAKEIVKKLDKAIEGISQKLDKGDKDVEETDRFRLQLYRDETLARSAEAVRGETYALAALRFLTGIQVGFDAARYAAQDARRAARPRGPKPRGGEALQARG